MGNTIYKTRNVKVDFSFDKKEEEGIRTRLYRAQTEKLKDWCRDVLRLARNTAGYENRTHNLQNSIFAAIYFKGKLEDTVFLNEGALAINPYPKTGSEETETGRGAAVDFISSYRPMSSRGWEVVFAATAYYSAYLEGGTDRHGKFQVLGGILNKVETSGLKNVSRLYINVYSYTR